MLGESRQLTQLDPAKKTLSGFDQNGTQRAENQEPDCFTLLGYPYILIGVSPPPVLPAIMRRDPSLLLPVLVE